MNKILAIILLIACSSCVTPYRSSGYMGGYSQTQLKPDEYLVRFNGNGYTANSRSTDFCLLRCAELTVENGYKYFVILDREKSESLHVTSNTAFTTPSNENRIKMSNEKYENSYDANFLIGSISEKYDIKIP